ncbi:MAG: hypothetical protein H7Y43_17915 [Akkermansiaceae bacterium]|nr:hypothetical protein [Verrucomicrobiales bacterium]
MTPNLASLDAPVPPADFRGRTQAVKIICGRLLNAERQSTSLVGGPRTGKTSLLRYLASTHADSVLPQLPYRVYLDAQLLSSSSKPADFWLQVFLGLQEKLTAGTPLAILLAKKIAGAQTRPFDNYDLQDVFDAFAKTDSPVVALVDSWDMILKNQNYWGDFFHLVRSLGQRQPRGLAFVVATPRRLLDLWSDQIGSVYYNIFANVTIGRLEETEVLDQVRSTLATAQLPENPGAEQVVLAASDRHPYLVALVTRLVANQLKQAGKIDRTAIGASLRDPNGPVVSLVRDIRAALSPSERLWLDNLRTAPQLVTPTQRAALERLRDYGLLPPGTNLG